MIRIFTEKIGKVCKQICLFWHVCDIFVTQKTTSQSEHEPGWSGECVFFKNVTDRDLLCLIFSLWDRADRKIRLKLCLTSTPCKFNWLFPKKYTHPSIVYYKQSDGPSDIRLAIETVSYAFRNEYYTLFWHSQPFLITSAFIIHDPWAESP